MSRRSLGLGLCVLGFIAVCVLALTSTAQRPFAGLAGIENGLEDKASQVLVDNGIDTGAAAIDADGREITVQLPETVPASFNRVELQNQLDAIEGVRGAVTLDGTPTIASVPSTDTPDPDPTEVPDPEPTPEPTEVPPTAVPQAGPTATPEPEPEPTPEPTAEPAPEPTAVPRLSDIVAEFARSPIGFEEGTAVLTSEDTGVLSVIADQLAGQTGGPIEVQAHTDNLGDPDVNLLLSQDRAQAVTDYLIEQGVDSALLTPRGYGASQPIADNSTEQGRADNRRVVFVVEGN